MSTRKSSYLLIKEKNLFPFCKKKLASSKALSFFEIGPSQSVIKILLFFSEALIASAPPQFINVHYTLIDMGC